MIHSIQQQVADFIKDWHSDSPTICVQTSGSTGTPKKMDVKKTRMLESAKITCQFFGLKKNDKALLCLPLQYIAGKMVVVRALYAGLDLYSVEPCGHPLADVDMDFDFAAMIPLQVYNSLQIPEERQRLAAIKYLIIGGGAIDETLEHELSGFPNAIYSTYGMTETLSHIALRRISGSAASLYYTPLSNVRVSLSQESTLIIDAPLVANETLFTNDIAALRCDGTFRILGRKDNVINSGGIKIQIEEVERILRPHITGNFAISHIPHPKLGEAIVLLTEEAATIELKNKIRHLLPRYQEPLHICFVEAIPLTGNGKPDRKAIKKLAEQVCPASTH
ncbi:AMP-binding protein [Massilibacteroides vaginae]|uniref:AMP-binding protein n=1 Tax=Massilibacteroides vaginae TaxID=1673718 RepID=UPI000A1CEDBF|nr:AMP-binding protein [Massilibacteroides vaginae]